MKIGCSGPVRERSGIGVLQSNLYEFLATAGHDLVFSKPRDVGPSTTGKARGLVRGLRPADGPVDVYLSTVSPFPYGVHAPTLSLIYDLRWLRTRTRAGAVYRGWDLRRTVASSDSLVCISEKTRRDLIAFHPRSAKKATVQLLGAGHVPDGSFAETGSALLMLVGGAPHKQNELAAAALAAARPSWIKGIVGVGVSSVVRDTLNNVYSCEWHYNVSDAQMLTLYQRAEFFMMLGTEEGFGLPFVEALSSGCQVIATNHSLAQEVLENAGTFLDPGDAVAIGEQLRVPPTVPSDVRLKRASSFSWKTFGRYCEEKLLEIANNATR